MPTKYLKIYQELVEELRSGRYEVGELLPSDAKLVQRYAVARETVRRAVQRLVNEGYVQRVKGKGTLVLGLKALQYPLTSLVSYREIMEKQLVAAETEIVQQVGWSKLPTALLEGELELPDIEYMHVIRRRKVNQKPILFDHDYINPLVVPMVTEEIAAQSLFSFFEQELKLKISHAVRSMVIEMATAIDCKILGIKREIPVVVIRNATFLDDNRLLAITESRHRADYFKNVEIAKRMQRGD